MQFFTRLDEADNPLVLNGEDWLRVILEPSLGPSVPEDVRELFEVARGAMIYGYFFYPLFTLSGEQLMRVAEAAASHRCRQLDAPASVKRFKQKIEWLRESGAISQADYIPWDATREMRNRTSHPAGQSVFPPGFATQGVAATAAMINRLFGDA